MEICFKLLPQERYSKKKGPFELLKSYKGQLEQHKLELYDFFSILYVLLPFFYLHQLERKQVLCMEQIASLAALISNMCLIGFF